MVLLLRVIWSLVVVCTLALSTKVANQSYFTIPINQFSFCSRRLNATMAVGCATESGGKVGVVWVANTTEQVEYLLAHTNGSAYMLAIPAQVFADYVLMKKLITSKYIAGLVVFETPRNQTEDLPKDFSEDSVCPNVDYGLYRLKSDCRLNGTHWNLQGTNYALMNWPFPVILLYSTTDEYRKTITKCFVEHNLIPPSGRRCSMQITNFMSATINAETCLRRSELMRANVIRMEDVKYCSAMPGQNTYLHAAVNVTSQPSLRKNDSILLVVVRFDAMSMFDDAAFGAKSVAPAISVLLPVIKLLFNLTEFTEPSKDVVFTFLDNESFDYLGSARLVYDLNLGFAPWSGQSIDMSQIGSVLEIGPLGSALSGTFYMHRDKDRETPEIKKLVTAMMKNLKSNVSGSRINLVESSAMSQLPPASSQRILRNKTLPVVYLADFDKTYGDPYFHSFLDRSVDTSSLPLTDLANTLAHFIYKEATGNDLNATVSEGLAENLLDCFVHNPQCDLFRLVISDREWERYKNVLPPLTTQNAPGNVQYKLQTLAERLIIIYAGRIFEANTFTDCQKVDKEYPQYQFHYNTFNGSSACIGSTVSLRSNLSPNNYQDNFNWTSREDASWVLSEVMGERGVRLFLVPSRLSEVGLVVSGVILTLMSIGIVAVIKSHVGGIFPR